MADLLPDPVPSSLPSRKRFAVAGVLLVVLATACYGGWQLWLRGQRANLLEQVDLGEFAAVESQLVDLARWLPRDEELLASLAKGYLQGKNDDEAEVWLNRWCERCHFPTEALRLRLGLLRKQQRFAEAIPDAQLLVERFPEDPALRYQLAALYFSNAQLALAEKECLSSLEWAPKHRETRRLLTDVYRAQGKLQQASRLSEELLKEDPASPSAMMMRAILHVDSGEPQQAIPLLKQVLALDPTRQRTARYQLAIAYERAGQPDEARKVQKELHQMQEAEVLRDALTAQPDNLNVLVRAGSALLRSGDIPAGLELLGRALEMDPLHRQAHAALAAYYDSIGEKKRAADHRHKAQISSEKMP